MSTFSDCIDAFLRRYVQKGEREAAKDSLSFLFGIASKEDILTFSAMTPEQKKFVESLPF